MHYPAASQQLITFQMRLWLISLSLMGTALASPDASPYPMPYPMAAPYPMERKRHFGTHKV